MNQPDVALTIVVFKNLVKENQEQKERIRELKDRVECETRWKKDWCNWYEKARQETKEVKKELLQTKKALTLLIKSIKEEYDA